MYSELHLPYLVGRENGGKRYGPVIRRGNYRV